ncbi:hypothetical protein FUAX_31040 [Fulvitalea axinellae]|uniref:NFACT RNA-binding domain-containing protein n=1 Tax=Fulvitalea axinellae TaxID=1182444 RepID=A0AAU9CYX4_9BACT|nr:hypothetical protein FUAX_31040 [Fulvitalea axinellae]
MHNNYYFLRRLSQDLAETLCGWKLVECFSQSKDELIMGFCAAGDQEFYIRASLQGDFSCLSFPDEYHRARKNSVNLFGELSGLAVTGVRQYENERAFALLFEQDYALLFKMHGNRSNLILFKENELLSVFKSSLKNDFSVSLAELDRPIERTEKALEEADGDWRALYPTFGKRVQAYLESSGWDDLDIQAKWSLLNKAVGLLDSGEFWVMRTERDIYLTLLPEEGAEKLPERPTAAITEFYSIYAREYYLRKERADAIRRLTSEISKTKNYIKKAEKKLAGLKHGVKYNELADVLMANLHAVPERAKSVDLFNFYTNESVTIKLKPKLSPQKNAEELYRKSKNQKLEVDNLNENLERKYEELLSQEELLETIDEANTVRELRKILKKDVKRGQEKQQKVTRPFYVFSHKGFELWVGKNPKSNDELLQRHSYKEDLWLHAKDVTGSHVLLKHKSGKVFPKDVIEYAAQVAAYYSKRKTDSLCPVTVTPRKYIRKQKGSAAGKVLIDKEDVILVTPQKA